MTDLDYNHHPAILAAVAENLSRLGEQFANGRQWALFSGIELCAVHDLPMPDWIATAMLSAIRRVRAGKAGSWDEVLGQPYPRGTHLAAVRKARRNTMAVWLEVEKMRRDGLAVDAAITAVGCSRGLGKTLAGDYYYAEKRRMDALAAAMDAFEPDA